MIRRGIVRPLSVLAALCLGAAPLLLPAPDARAQSQPQAQPQPPTAGFSFYGVKFGMTKAEIDQKWLPLSGGAYAVSSPAIKQIKPSFDHEGRLYEFSFSVGLDFPDDPAALVRLAFQQALNEKGRKDSGLVVNLSAGPEAVQVTIIHERLRDGYVKHLQGKVSLLLQP